MLTLFGRTFGVPLAAHAGTTINGTTQAVLTELVNDLQITRLSAACTHVVAVDGTEARSAA